MLWLLRMMELLLPCGKGQQYNRVIRGQVGLVALD